MVLLSPFFSSGLAVASHPELAKENGPEDHFLHMETCHS
ncbi:uncharacterized protein G2W53_003840 [Senna tora]|uniref:Uncharacterized protein n=1 Tax=Senna tora TaxID=362788 RepID=A0A834XBB5_9FABA|nr:uncharacterized protein G2W53_003840 [Senna tora]